MKKRKITKIILCVFGQIFVFLLILLTFSLIWCFGNFGNIGLNEIVFTLNMPLKDASAGFVGDYIQTALFPAAVLFIIEALIICWPWKGRYYLKFSDSGRTLRWKLMPVSIPVPVTVLVMCVWFAGLFYAADQQFGAVSYIQSQLMQSELIEKEYVNPNDVQITFPEQKRNLIFIFVESLETSMQDQANGGLFDVNYIPELTEIAKENTSFSQSNLLEGAAVAPASGWTIAGMTAETAGLPLKLFEYNHKGRGGINNSMSKYEYFLPGAVSLGEILEREGYYNYIMFGSKARFGGKTTYYEQHGNYEVWDYDNAVEEGKIAEDYYVNWGFEDQKLYAYAKEKILEVAAKGQPFNFSMLTSDSHTPAGYLCEKCPDTYEDPYANVLACMSAQLDEFLTWLSKQSFYENSTIVVCGDHCSMVKGFFGEYSYDRHHGEAARKVYNAFIQPLAVPKQEENRLFTTMDIFPTVVAALGGEIEGDRLGLGTNLFSGEETLAEKYGFEVLFEELNKKSRFYDNEILYP